jgi:hypothetical protein
VKYLVGRIHGDAAYERVLPPHMPLGSAERNLLDHLAETARAEKPLEKA